MINELAKSFAKHRVIVHDEYTALGLRRAARKPRAGVGGRRRTSLAFNIFGHFVLLIHVGWSASSSSAARNNARAKLEPALRRFIGPSPGNRDKSRRRPECPDRAGFSSLKWRR